MNRLAHRETTLGSNQIHATGFSILEALVTLVVISAGLLGLAGLQSTLTREADASRHRGEATRLAQEQIEAIRSFSQTGSVKDNHPPETPNWEKFGWKDLDELAEQADANLLEQTNTIYTRTLELSDGPNDRVRLLRVQVSWLDRATSDNDDQKPMVELYSAIASSDPVMSGELYFSLPIDASLGVRQIFNRHLNIPYPAVDLGNGESAYRISDDRSIIFNNELGSVVKQCSIAITTAEQAGDKNLCPTVTGYVVTGYISSGTDAALLSRITGISLAKINGLAGTPPASCHVSDAISYLDGSTINGYKHYLCLLPVPKNDDPWSGTVLLTVRYDDKQKPPVPNADIVICRYQYKSPAVTDNERNKQPYVDVRMSLDNQNYRIAAADSCPVLPVHEREVASLELHQNCRGNNASKDVCPDR